MTLLVLIGSVLLLLVVRVPVAFALLLPSMVYIAQSDALTLGIAVQRTTSGVNSFPLLAVPLFILMGNLANASGLTDRLFEFAETLIGHVQNSLGYVNVLVSFVFAWMSGAAIADAAGLGKIEVPSMVQRGYTVKFSVGITAASSTIGPIMPPSIPAVIYAVTAGVSLGGLLVAGIVPAVVIALSLAIAVWVLGRKQEAQSRDRATLRELGKGASAAVLPLFTPVILVGGILGGVFTPTEAAGVAVAYIFVLGVLAYRSVTLKALYRLVLSTAETTGAIMLIVAAGSLFGWILALERAPQMLADLILGVTSSPVFFLLLVNVLLLVVGMILEPASALLIMVPVLLPVATEFGVDPLHFGMIVIFNLMIGLVTPPIGLVLYVLSSVTEVPFGTVVRGTAPFLIPLGAALMLITFVPAISLWLPTRSGFG